MTMCASSPKRRKATLSDVEVEIVPGLVAGQKTIPIESAGCYVPGGRYSHVASAIMTVTTARSRAASTSPSARRPGRMSGSIRPFSTPPISAVPTPFSPWAGSRAWRRWPSVCSTCRRPDILVGPGNQFVAEAKRILFGRVGIDMFAGPTDSLILADKAADPEIVAADLVGQAEHGYNSPVWLVHHDKAALAEKP
jgi:sulfopropanediol 3-dehydrogenase